MLQIAPFCIHSGFINNFSEIRNFMLIQKTIYYQIFCLFFIKSCRIHIECYKFDKCVAEKYLTLCTKPGICQLCSPNIEKDIHIVMQIRMITETSIFRNFFTQN